ncbi:MAG: vWA domain-containing protein [bacterium]
MNDVMSMMEKVSIRLIQNSPFYASLISQMRKIECTGDLAKQIPTEAVAIENGRINFYFNPKFLETLTVDEAVAVLTHECKHVVLGHLTRMRDEYKENHHLANIAQDMNANRDIAKLPKSACTVESITQQWAKQGMKLNLKPDDTSENYYKELNKHSNKMEMKTDGEGNLEITIKDPKGNEIGKMKITTTCNNGDKQSDANENGDVPELAKEVIRQAIKEAVDANNKARGQLPHGLEEAIAEWLKPPVISWRTLLKKFLAASIKSGSKRSWKRPNRRFGEFQKGKLSDRMVSVSIAIDTSGSISDEDFKSFISELKAIKACYKGTMTVMECDAKIQKTYKLDKYKKVQTNFRGRGGTSFVPVFEYIKEKKLKTDLLIFFTDLCGDQESCKKPPYPVLWVATVSAHGQKMPFGHVLSLVDNPDKRDKK